MSSGATRVDVEVDSATVGKPSLLFLSALTHIKSNKCQQRSSVFNDSVTKKKMKDDHLVCIYFHHDFLPCFFLLFFLSFPQSYIPVFTVIKHCFIEFEGRLFEKQTHTVSFRFLQRFSLSPSLFQLVSFPARKVLTISILRVHAMYRHQFLCTFSLSLSRLVSSSSLSLRARSLRNT